MYSRWEEFISQVHLQVKEEPCLNRPGRETEMWVEVQDNSEDLFLLWQPLISSHNYGSIVPTRSLPLWQLLSFPLLRFFCSGSYLLSVPDLSRSAHGFDSFSNPPSGPSQWWCHRLERPDNCQFLERAFPVLWRMFSNILALCPLDAIPLPRYNNLKVSRQC